MEATLLHDMIEERAAILEYCGGMIRTQAQDTAARAHGFKDWAAYKETTK